MHLLQTNPRLLTPTFEQEKSRRWRCSIVLHPRAKSVLSVIFNEAGHLDLPIAISLRGERSRLSSKPGAAGR